MKTNTAIKTQVRTGEKVTYKEFDRLGVITLGIVAFGIGAWALTSLAVAASTIGIGGLVKGFITAVGMV